MYKSTKSALFFSSGLLLSIVTLAQNVQLTVSVHTNRKLISPHIYGKNNSFSDNACGPTCNINGNSGGHVSDWKFLRAAGLKFSRDGGGNNSTKYNWRLKLSSHPDWYNNVFSHDWAYASKLIQKNMPGFREMWSFQLLGYAAKSSAYNFNDGQCDPSHSNTGQGWAGGGGSAACGGNGGNGDPNLYLQAWTADSTVGILPYFFGPTSAGGLNLDKSTFQYWNMDNEPESWSSLHKDVDPSLTGGISAEGYMQRYFNVAIRARQLFPDIKLVGPVTTNESAWFKWNGALVTYKGNSYTWIEYFIKRVGEKQDSTGLRLLDVLDFHFYPGFQNGSAYTDIAGTLQFHRVWFDSTYAYPYSYGVSAIAGSNKKVYIWSRCNKWLNQYLGEGHGVTFGLSEAGTVANTNANVAALWYASHLGLFAQHNVDLFAPWDWYVGMWEVLHLFTRYGKPYSVQSVSNNETYVSGYASVDSTGDSLTVILLNRNATSTSPAAISLTDFNVPDGAYTYKRLSNLTTAETFVSETSNALTSGTISVTGNNISIKLPPYSITALILKGASTATSVTDETPQFSSFEIAPNPFGKSTVASFNLLKTAAVTFILYDISGKPVRHVLDSTLSKGAHTVAIDSDSLPQGVYFATLAVNGQKATKKIIVSN